MLRDGDEITSPFRLSTLASVCSVVHRGLVGKIVGAVFQPRLSRLESRSHSEIEVDKKNKTEDFPTNPR